jgi:excisionase family DNA binding protein
MIINQGKDSIMTHDQETPRQELLLTIRRTGKLLSLSRAMVYLLIQRGELRCIHIGRAVRVSEAELRRWLHEREQAERQDE